MKLVVQKESVAIVRIDLKVGLSNFLNLQNKVALITIHNFCFLNYTLCLGHRGKKI
jgi:hypothetical protein